MNKKHPAPHHFEFKLSVRQEIRAQYRNVYKSENGLVQGGALVLSCPDTLLRFTFFVPAPTMNTFQANNDTPCSARKQMPDINNPTVRGRVVTTEGKIGYRSFTWPKVWRLAGKITGYHRR